MWQGRVTEGMTVRACIEWAFAQCGHLRIDTHPDNTVMQDLLAKTGFTRCGVIHVVEDDNPRFAYERVAAANVASLLS